MIPVVPIRWMRRLIIMLRVVSEISQRLHQGTTENCRQLLDVIDELETLEPGDRL
jgi:hypothetical protein